jgi:hypothetical protein
MIVTERIDTSKGFRPKWVENFIMQASAHTQAMRAKPEYQQSGYGWSDYLAETGLLENITFSEVKSHTKGDGDKRVNSVIYDFTWESEEQKTMFMLKYA